MDSPSLREQLESAGLRGRDLQEPELAELRRALEDDPQLYRRFRDLLQYYVRLAEAFGEVPVPAGLRERLLSAMIDDEPMAVEDRPAAERGGRRWFGRRLGWELTAVAATLLVALWAWRHFFPPR